MGDVLMHKIVIDYQVLIKKEYLFADLQTMFLQGEIPDEDLDYQVVLDDRLVKVFDNPKLDETNTFELEMILFVDDTKYKNIAKSLIHGCYELDGVEVELNDWNLVAVKYNMAIYYSNGYYYMVKSDFTPFTEEGLFYMEDTWDAFLMWYIDTFGPISAENRKIIAYANDDCTIIKIVSDLKLSLEIPINDYGDIFRRIPS